MVYNLHDAHSIQQQPQASFHPWWSSRFLAAEREMQESQYASAGSLHTMVCLPFFLSRFLFLKRNPITRRFHKWGCSKIGMFETYSFWLKTNMFEHRYFETFPNNGVPNPSFDTGIPLKCVRQVQSSLACWILRQNVQRTFFNLQVWTSPNIIFFGWGSNLNTSMHHKICMWWQYIFRNKFG